MGVFNKIFRTSDKTQEDLKLGDWVNSYSKGVFRVELIIDEYYDESSAALFNNKIGDKRELRTFVSKRFLNSKYKKSFSYESCSEAYISHLNNSQKEELNNFITKNPLMLNELDDYKIPIRIEVFTSDLQIGNNNDLKLTKQLIEYIRSGRTFLQIETEMRRLDILRLKQRNFGNFTFQLFNYDNEYIDKRKIWKDAILTKKE